MKTKLKSVLSCTTSAIALSFAASFTAMAGVVPSADVVETEDKEKEKLPLEEETAALRETDQSEELEETDLTEDQNETEEAEDTEAAAEEEEEVQGEEEADEADSDWSMRVMANVETCVNIRKGPGTDTDRVGLLYKGGAADILERGEEWTKVRSGEIEGYIFNQYLLFDEEAKAMAEEVMETVATVEVSALNIREEASTESKKLGLAQKEQELTVAEEEIEEEEDWIAIDLGDSIGYVHADYVVVETKLGEAKSIEEVVQEEQAQKAAANSSSVQASGSAAASYSNSELDLMAAIIQCEAGGESYEGKVAVGAVVMNRVRSSSFPNNIYDVIYQSGQFSPVASGKLSSVLSQGARSDCYQAAQDALNGSNNVGGCLFFHAGSGNGMTIGNQTFY